MSTPEQEMPKAYDPTLVESRRYDWWQSRGYFTPEIEPGRKPYVIIMPPPNVTGELHVGHALFVAVEDILIRWRRMQGRPTLWLPGADHAGIAGQWVVEKELAEEGLTRHDLGREAFVERTWDWMNRYRSRIRDQLRILGASCDWTRFHFTMDPGPARAVRTTFKHLYDKGLIYRGERLINWCPRCMTALSDLEVNYEDVASYIWTLRYPVEGTDRFIEVATTRPETMLGDTAVAVHPEDERYADLVGRTAVLPIVGRKLRIVADEAVDPQFGTGAVKVTPAHDPNDFAIAQRHDLPAVNILNLDGTLNAEAGQYERQSTEEARRNIVHRLEEEGYLVSTQAHTHSVGTCDRCGTIVEPIISKQWFVKMEPLARPAVEVVRDGTIGFVPDRFKGVYLHWMENVYDWCISRQLWWGHRIPVWYCGDCQAVTASVEEEVEACPSCGSGNIEQDPDVLDTWFSSGLWPFSTLGWPDDTEDLRYFYPGSVMETGYDIIFLWVARMIFFGLELMHGPPFFTVYLHGIVRDEHGQRMSKTKGNVIDPTAVTRQYGSDALRFALITAGPAGSDLKLSLQRVESMRNFANKVWNASRYVLRSIEPEGVERGEDGAVLRPDAAQAGLAERWILSRLESVTAEVTGMLERFQLGEAGRRLYDFIWAEFADWYIESSKVALGSSDASARAAARQTLAYVHERSLRLLHPFMPFLTEELWQHLPHSGEALIVAPWPEAGERDPEAEQQYDLLIEVVRAVRNARAEHEVPAARLVSALVAGGPDTAVLREQAEVISRLARIDPTQLEIVESAESVPEGAVSLLVGGVQVYLPLAGLVDLAEERRRLEAELADAERGVERTRGLLSNEQFVQRAPSHVVERENARLAEAEERASLLRERLRSLAGTPR